MQPTKTSLRYQNNEKADLHLSFRGKTRDTRRDCLQEASLKKGKASRSTTKATEQCREKEVAEGSDAARTDQPKLFAMEMRQLDFVVAKCKQQPTLRCERL